MKFFNSQETPDSAIDTTTSNQSCLIQQALQQIAINEGVQYVRDEYGITHLVGPHAHEVVVMINELVYRTVRHMELYSRLAKPTY